MKVFYLLSSVCCAACSILFSGCGGSSSSGSAPDTLAGRTLMITFANNTLPNDWIDRCYLTSLRIQPTSNSVIGAMTAYNGASAEAPGEVGRYLYEKTGDNSAIFFLSYTVGSQAGNRYTCSIRVDELTFSNGNNANGAAVLTPGGGTGGIAPPTGTANLRIVME